MTEREARKLDKQCKLMAHICNATGQMIGMPGSVMMALVERAGHEVMQEQPDLLPSEVAEALIRKVLDYMALEQESMTLHV